jgi:hypothetical protein
MKTVFAFLLFSAMSFAAAAHEYFFAFAEIGYNRNTGSFEIALQGSAHDVEDVMNESGIAVKELEDHYDDPEMLAKIEAFIRKGLALTSGGKTAALHLDGMEVLPNGLVYFYLSSDPIELTDSVVIRFDWLMDTLPKQQNKITLTHNDRKYTAVFLPHQTSSTIAFLQSEKK